jgi:SPP1 family predicted phage head-tail adaptor
MRAGKLDRRITIQTPATGQDAFGEPLSGWTNVVTDGDGKVCAAITDMTGREYLAAAATQNSVETKIYIRYRPGITAAMRVLHGADVYNIAAVLGQDRRQLLLMCTRGVNDG